MSAPQYSSPSAAYSGSPHVGVGPAKSQKAAFGRGAQRHDDMFPEPEWRDLWAAILFYLHAAAFLALSAYFIGKAPWAEALRRPATPEGARGADDTVRYILSALSAILPMLAMVGGSMKAMHAAPEKSIHAGYIVNMAFLALAAVATALQPGSGLSPLLYVLGLAITAFIYYGARKRIPFSAVIMRTVVGVIDIYPGLLIVTAAFVALSIVYGCYLGVAFAALAITVKAKADRGLYAAVALYYVFSTYWVIQVIGNVLQTTIAGTYATFYFLHGTGQQVANPTAGSLRRACTYSFGSICVGSLIVASLQFLRFLLRGLRDERNWILILICDVLLSIVEDLVAYFNYYAYTQIAIYGKPYFASAKDALALIQSHGIDAIVNDHVVGTCTGMYALATGIVSGATCAGAAFLIFSEYSVISHVGVPIAWGFCGIFIASMAFQIIGAGATTTFVCLAEDPAALARSNPELYRTIVASYPQVAA